MNTLILKFKNNTDFKTALLFLKACKLDFTQGYSTVQLKVNDYEHNFLDLLLPEHNKTKLIVLTK